LSAGDLDRFGELLHAHWEVKKRTAGNMTTGPIDAWYALAREHGATGGKLMGAGGGGFLMLYAPNGEKPRLRSTLTRAGLREVRLAIEPEGAKVMLNI
jgi:D-glycero-alpha-D-manno-heptose-7-phosphate kinase